VLRLSSFAAFAIQANARMCILRVLPVPIEETCKIFVLPGKGYKNALIRSWHLQRIPHRKSDDTSRTRRVSATPAIALLPFTGSSLFSPKRALGVKRLTRRAILISQITDGESPKLVGEMAISIRYCRACPFCIRTFCISIKNYSIHRAYAQWPFHEV